MSFTIEPNITYLETVTDDHLISTSVNDMNKLMWLHDSIFEISSIVKLILCIFGLIGNLFVFIGLWREHKKSSTTFLLQCLAFADGCNLIAWIKVSLNMYFVKTLKIFGLTTVNLFTSFLSVWTVVLLAVSRYVIICHPFKAKRL